MAIDFRECIMSTGKHYISNSGYDENNNYHGSKAWTRAAPEPEPDPEEVE